ncbi:MAG: ABC transporter ATP-binding protein [Saprospiraceae bacterium]|nr:ABC transporter ATP-binding protein [Saprospiraceae bacterium]
MKNLFQLNHYILRYKNKLLLGIVFVFLSNLFRVFQPIALRKALDRIVDFMKMPESLRQSEELVMHLMKFGIIVLGCAILMGLFMYFMRQTIIVMSRLVEYDMRKDIFAHYLKMDIGFFKRNKTGDLMSRISEDVNKVRMYLGPAFLYGFNLISLFIVVIFTMFKVNFMLSIYTLAPLPLLSIIIYKVSNLINKRSERIQSQLAKITTISQEAYSGIRIIKSFNTNSWWEKYFDKETEKFKTHSLDLAKVDSLFFPSMFLLVGISTLITIYVGGLSVFSGTVSAGNIAEFVIYINMLTWPVSAIGWCASIIQQAEASQKRINEFLNTQPEIIDHKEQNVRLSNFDIAFENVTFHYPENHVLALKNIQVKIPHGKKVAIVGKTASGKSSFAELLVRMYDPNEGKITIGEVNLNKIPVHELRSIIAYVPQDVFLFSDTIYNNILFGVDEEIGEIAESKLKRIAVAASLNDEVSSFPDGYETILGERGVTLSGGQKQRVGISRALIKDSQILVFDDSLSAVDSITEEKIFSGVQEWIQDKTFILITHRISQTRNMDLILVMSENTIVEQGTFDELLQKKGFFSKMYHNEMSRTQSE